MSACNGAAAAPPVSPRAAPACGWPRGLLPQRAGFLVAASLLWFLASSLLACAAEMADDTEARGDDQQTLLSRSVIDGQPGHGSSSDDPMGYLLQDADEDERKQSQRKAGMAGPPVVGDAVRVAAVVRSVIAGLSTTLGAGVVLFLQGPPTPGQMAFALALAAGVMLTVSVVEMWMPQLTKPGARLETVLGAAAGALGFLALKSLVPEPQLAHPKACEDLEDGDLGLPRGQGSQGDKQQRQWRLAVLLTLALTAHNFPEGLAVAVSSLQSGRLGFVVMAAIAVHNIPEGVAIAMPVLDATGSRMRAMQMATLSGLAEPLGAVMAVVVLPEGAVSGRGMDLLLCIVGGIMSCVAAIELLPEAHAQRRPWCVAGGMLAGAGIMLATHELA